MRGYDRVVKDQTLPKPYNNPTSFMGIDISAIFGLRITDI